MPSINYEEMKSQVNERAKRQILRKCKKYMISNGFSVDDVKELDGTTQETINLYIKILNAKS